MIKQAARESLVLILAAVGISLAVYAVRPDKIGITPSAVNQGAGQQLQTDSGFSEITIKDAVRRHREKSAIFADSRHASDFEAGHIKGAVHLYTADQALWLPEFIATTDAAAVIVTYCDGDDCSLAPELAELLFLNGFENVYFLKNGWTRWREGGYPAE